MRSKMDLCGNCTGFIPAHASVCPNCRAVGRRGASSGTALTRLRLLAGALGGGAVAFTLMACYGAPCASDNCGNDYDGGGQDDDASRDATKPDVQVGSKDAATDASDDGSSAITDSGDSG